LEPSAIGDRLNTFARRSFNGAGFLLTKKEERQLGEGEEGAFQLLDFHFF